MRSVHSFFTAVAISAALAAPITAEEYSGSTVIATVNGEDITLGHLMVAYATLPDQYRQLPTGVLFDGILDQLIQQTALAQNHDGDLPRYVALSLDNERRSLIAADTLEQVMADAASDEDIETAYNEKYASFDEQEFDASHILVETEAEAHAVVEELNAGADFAETAKAKSTGPSGPRGGALGWFSKGMMVPEFEEVVVGMEPGAISEPVQTQFGWHVIRLNDRRTKSAPPMEEVREELAGEIRKSAADAYVEGLVAGANVERPALDGLNREIMRDLNALEN